MRSSSPVIILTRDEAAEIASRYNDLYQAATAEDEDYSHTAYTERRAAFASTLYQLTGIRTPRKREDVETAFFDNSGPLDVAGVVVSLALTGHNVVLDRLFVPEGSDHYAVRALVG